MTPTWDSTDLDSGTDDGVVHESTPDTAYDDASEIRKGDATADPYLGNELSIWYPMQESSGSTVHDFSGNGIDGTASGASPADGGTTFTGLPVWYFDGTDDIVEIPNQTTQSAISISLWVYLTSYSYGGDLHNIFSSGYNGTTVEFALRHSENSDAIEWFAYDGNRLHGIGAGNTVGGNIVVDETNIPLNTWTHVACVYDGSDYVLYIGGSEIARRTDSYGPNDANNSEYWSVGGGYVQGSPDRYTRMYASDVRFYNGYGLSQSEVQAIRDIFAAESSHTSTKKQL